MIRKFSFVLAAMIAMSAVLSSWPSYGAVPKLDTIRVAIYLNLPGKFTTTQPAVTLSATDKLSIGLRQPSKVDALLTLEAGSHARFAVNDYKVRVGETTSFADASALVKQLQAKSNAVLLNSMTRAGKTLYYVSEGSYATETEALAAKDKWSGDAAMLGMAGAVKPYLAGPLHLESGPFATLAEARKAAAAVGAAEMDQYIAMRIAADTGKMQYYVHIGSAANASERLVIRAEAAKLAELGELRDLADGEAYVQVRDDYTLSGNANAAEPLYLLAANGAKLWLSTSDNASIKLNERGARAYRGQFEISVFNNRLAVVNELPFEQYLYSVVGAEMPASWPLEALKAQAVAARSYALYQGSGFQIAHVVDSVLSQVYSGIATENQATITAVDATAGEVAMYEGRVIEALFSSSAGGSTADATEIWGNPVPYLTSTPSPDQNSENGLYSWYYVVLPDGKVGYIREDLLEQTTSKSAGGQAIMQVKGNGVMVRPIPLIQNEVAPVSQVDNGTRVVILEKVVQSNEMRWVRGPFTSEMLSSSMKDRVQTPVAGPIQSLEISKLGPSGRVIEMKVNGQLLELRYPDLLRSTLGGLPSTRFEVEETARVSLLAAQGTRSERTGSEAMYVIGANGQTRAADETHFFVLNGKGQVRAATKDTSFRFLGQGNGHGVGLSQYGARGLAEQGYDYQYILKYYYNNATIGKD